MFIFSMSELWSDMLSFLSSWLLRYLVSCLEKCKQFERWKIWRHKIQQLWINHCFFNILRLKKLQVSCIYRMCLLNDVGCPMVLFSFVIEDHKETDKMDCQKKSFKEVKIVHEFLKYTDILHLMFVMSLFSH